MRFFDSAMRCWCFRAPTPIPVELGAGLQFSLQAWLTEMVGSDVMPVGYRRASPKAGVVAITARFRRKEVACVPIMLFRLSLLVSRRQANGSVGDGSNLSEFETLDATS